jgi:hypothetical protein
MRRHKPERVTRQCRFSNLQCLTLTSPDMTVMPPQSRAKIAVAQVIGAGHDDEFNEWPSSPALLEIVLVSVQLLKRPLDDKGRRY